MRKRALLVRLVLIGGLVLGALNGRAQTKSVDGEWRGVWTNPAGFVYSAEVTLIAGPGCKTCAAAGNGSIRGWIVWTLRKAGSNAPPEMAAKVGATGKESVSGEMAGEGFFVLKGVGKEDPDNIVDLDQYRLAVADNGDVIGGITRNNGSWTGQFIAMRTK
jgi:hypothetical protein